MYGHYGFWDTETTMQSETSIEIDRPIDDVFRLTNDHVAEWSIIVVEDEVLNEKPGVVGTTFRTVTEERGKRMVFQGLVTRQGVLGTDSDTGRLLALLAKHGQLKAL